MSRWISYPTSKRTGLDESNHISRIDTQNVQTLIEMYGGQQPSHQFCVERISKTFPLERIFSPEPEYMVHACEDGRIWWELYPEFWIRTDLFQGYAVNGYNHYYICGTQHFMGPMMSQGMVSASLKNGYELVIDAIVETKTKIVQP